MKDWRNREIPAGESFKLEDGQGVVAPTKQMFPEMPMYLVKAIPCDEEGEVVHLGAVLERLEAKVDGLLERARLEERKAEQARWTKHLRALQRCTCPPTPGVVRTTHEPWCPYGILNALEQKS